MEEKIRHQLPPSFRSFVARYDWESFDWKGLTFLGTLTPSEFEPPSLWQTLEDDPHKMTPFLLARGFVPFARPDTGDFDRICFDTNSSYAEVPIVRLDHEAQFLSNETRITDVIADSFREFIR